MIEVVEPRRLRGGMGASDAEAEGIGHIAPVADPDLPATDQAIDLIRPVARPREPLDEFLQGIAGEAHGDCAALDGDAHGVALLVPVSPC